MMITLKSKIDEEAFMNKTMRHVILNHSKGLMKTSQVDAFMMGVTYTIEQLKLNN